MLESIVALVLALTRSQLGIDTRILVQGKREQIGFGKIHSRPYSMTEP